MDQSADETAEPMGKHGPEKPETEKKKPDKNHANLNHGAFNKVLDYANGNSNREPDEKRPKDNPQEECEHPPTEGNARLRGGALPAAALGADGGYAWIAMQPRSEFHIEARPAEIVEERFALGQ